MIRKNGGRVATEGEKKKERRNREKGKRSVFYQKNEKRTERESALARAPFKLFLLTHENARQGQGSKWDTEPSTRGKESRVVPRFSPPPFSLSLSSLSRARDFSSSSFFFHLFYFFSFSLQRIKLLSGRWRGSPPWPWRVSVFRFSISGKGCAFSEGKKSEFFVFMKKNAVKWEKRFKNLPHLLLLRRGEAALLGALHDVAGHPIEVSSFEFGRNEKKETGKEVSGEKRAGE